MSILMFPDSRTRWPLRIACPLRRSQTAFEGPLEIRRLEWGADYPKWDPEDLAKRFGWYRRDVQEGKALQRAQELRSNDPTLLSQPP